MNANQWIRDGHADRLNKSRRVLDAIGCALIVVVFFLLALANAVFRLRFEDETAEYERLECIRNYAKPGAERYEGEKESLIKILF